MLTVYKVTKGSFIYKLVYGDNSCKTKESKNDWACSICNYCTSEDSAMFQVSNETRFHRICSECLISGGDFVDFCFGEGTTKLLRQYL